MKRRKWTDEEIEYLKNNTNKKIKDIANLLNRPISSIVTKISKLKIVYNRRNHGFKGTRIYKTWNNMKSRCYSQNNNRYYRYGGRGISVCPEWKNSFVSFKDWAIKNGYRDDLSIDRINNDGNYCPENCRWATKKEQMNNTSRNIR